MNHNNSSEQDNNIPKGHYDLTEESSKRPEGEGATEEARKAENDDAGLGAISGPNDNYAENKVATSLDDE